MIEQRKPVPATVRRYVVVGPDGKEHLVKSISRQSAVETVYETLVRVASGDDIERLLTSKGDSQ